MISENLFCVNTTTTTTTTTEMNSPINCKSQFTILKDECDNTNSFSFSETLSQIEYCSSLSSLSSSLPSPLIEPLDSSWDTFPLQSFSFSAELVEGSERKHLLREEGKRREEGEREEGRERKERGEIVEEERDWMLQVRMGFDSSGYAAPFSLSDIPIVFSLPGFFPLFSSLLLLLFSSSLFLTDLFLPFPFSLSLLEGETEEIYWLEDGIELWVGKADLLSFVQMERLDTVISHKIEMVFFFTVKKK